MSELPQTDVDCRRTCSLFDSALDAIVSLDVRGVITQFNAAAEAMFGYKAAEAIGQLLAELVIPVDQREAHRKGLATYRETGVGPIIGRRIEVEALHRDGHVFPVEMAVVAVGTGQPSFTAFIRDISERRRVEDALIKAKLQAEEASLAKSQFLASMSHELRTPLNGVIGMTELLMNTNLDDRQLQFVRACQNSGRALLSLINDILDLSKIEAGKLELDTHDFDLEQLVRDTTDLVWSHSSEKGLELICEFDQQARQIYSGDGTRLRQVLVNLLTNAGKFTDRGEIVLTVKVVEQRDSIAFLRFSVRDTGIGIPPDRVNRLFHSFSQVDCSTTRKYGGTGLGLSICKQLVDAMGGSIGVESQVGEGSTFFFTLPLEVKEKCDLDYVQDGSELADCRVLIVDDNSTNRTILQEQTRGWGMSPVVAATADQAVAVFLRAAQTDEPFDLIISDYDLPDKTGIELARSIGSIGDIPPFILLGSRSINDSIKDSVQAAGIRQQLTKPVLSTQLYTAIQSVIQSQRQQNSAPDVQLGVEGGDQKPTRPAFKGELLVAEDNTVNALYVTSLLNQAGYVTQTANNGLQAVLSVRTHKFALVLMDCQMPELDGFEATRCIRNLEEKGRLSGHVPIIALTANAIKGDAERCLEAGMDAYLSKPFEPKQLLRLVEQLARPVEVDCSPDEFAEDKVIPDSAVRHRGTTIEPEAKAPDPIVTTPPIDTESLLNRCMGDVEFAESLLRELETTGTNHVDEIARHFLQSDAIQVADAAHALKGAAAVLSAEHVRRLAANIEMTGRSGTLDGIEAAIDELRSEMDRCLNYIPAVIQTAQRLQAAATVGSHP